MKSRPNQKAYSLLELLGVLALIAIIAAVTMYRLNGLEKRLAKDNVAELNVDRLQAATERYYYDRSAYPENALDLVTAGYLPIEPSGPANYTYSVVNGIWMYSSGS